MGILEGFLTPRVGLSRHKEGQTKFQAQREQSCLEYVKGEFGEQRHKKKLDGSFLFSYCGLFVCLANLGCCISSAQSVWSVLFGTFCLFTEQFDSLVFTEQAEQNRWAQPWSRQRVQQEQRPRVGTPQIGLRKEPEVPWGWCRVREQRPEGIPSRSLDFGLVGSRASPGQTRALGSQGQVGEVPPQHILFCVTLEIINLGTLTAATITLQEFGPSLYDI